MDISNKSHAACYVSSSFCTSRKISDSRFDDVLTFCVLKRQKTHDLAQKPGSEEDLFLGF